MKHNVLEQCTGVKEKETAERLSALALCHSVQHANNAEAELKATLPDLWTYLEPLPREKYVRPYFPQQRFGISSNAIESFWALLKKDDLRSARTLAQFYISLYELNRKKLTQYTNREDIISMFAHREVQEICARAAGSRVSILDTATMRATIETQTGCSPLPILHFFCPHLTRLALHVSNETARKNLVPEPYWQASWKEVMAVSTSTPLSFSFTDHSPANPFLPPLKKGQRGRPKKENKKKSKKRITRSLKGSHKTLEEMSTPASSTSSSTSSSAELPRDQLPKANKRLRSRGT